ncbi:MAG: hypothetical protein UU93_C0005G0003 [Candidatus Amesbacteria bacterium GW2011_GWA2_42_12]|uniref:Uncharacterized protein n=1 Tax=Candidatus Amesbacteria bacterium GW2011_GWA2_42_12 TaxID=1618356 RepID=A0A0G0Y7L2_9BACT|nr:MAG: hypothetical protein UU93_C0005G0003 [Candidatus Amesbacteria bacterium GW2011_GWA2_42_12]
MTMAVRKSKIQNPKIQINSKLENTKTENSDLIGGQLDPKEEKVLDWILNGIVIFVLGWLALGIGMAVLGLFGVWK